MDNNGASDGIFSVDVTVFSFLSTNFGKGQLDVERNNTRQAAAGETGDNNGGI